MKVDNKFVLGVILAVVSIAGYVGLALSGQENLETARGVFLFSTPFITVLLGSSVFDSIKAKTEETKQTVDKRLNGELDGRIRAAVSTALEQNDLVRPNPNRDYGSTAYQNKEGDNNG